MIIYGYLCRPPKDSESLAALLTYFAIVTWDPYDARKMAKTRAR